MAYQAQPTAVALPGTGQRVQPVATTAPLAEQRFMDARRISSCRPQLTPGTVLLGQARDSGFKDTMWLVQIDGRFVQLTELLYRVAEQCDGGRSLDEIAARVSATTEWQMNADDAEYLLANKLIPARIVVSPDVSAEALDSRNSAPSLLQLGLRKGVISAAAIEPVAKRLQWLYLPALLIPLVTLGAVAHAWLYLDHGIDGLLANVLATPGLLLFVLIMSNLPGFWHEFGHASALRFGGGRARSIGVGIYIMDPAFYTDVTDSYRLSRWARIRTGLGGIYFDFLLSTVWIGLYLVTGHEVLLFLVVLSNINAIYQFFPLIRLDGYWILADLTGVPDFYSMMGAFIRSVVPLPAWQGARLPPLRPVAKAVFAIYTLIGFPGMMFFLFLMVRRMPSIFTRVSNAMRVELQALPDAWNQSDWILLGARISQILVLSVAMIGLAWFAFVMVRTYGLLLWKLGRHLFRRWRPAPQTA